MNSVHICAPGGGPWKRRRGVQHHRFGLGSRTGRSSGGQSGACAPAAVTVLGREGRAALPGSGLRGGTAPRCGARRAVRLGATEGRGPAAPPSLPLRGGLAGVVTLTCHSFFSSAGLRGAATGQRACPRGREVGGSGPAHAAWVLGGLSCWTVSSDHRGVPGGGRGPAPPAPAGSSCLPAMRWSLTHSPCRPPRHSYRPAEGCRGELGGQHVEQGPGGGRACKAMGRGRGCPSTFASATSRWCLSLCV